MERSERFFSQIWKDMKTWVFFMAYLSVFRVALIFVFRDKIAAATSPSDVFIALANGLRYDAMVSTYLIIIPFLLTLACLLFDIRSFADRIKGMWTSSYAVISTILFVVTIAYFREYNDQFNNFVFNLYYDDTSAILMTVWSQYHPILNIVAMAIVSLIVLLLQRRYHKSIFLDNIIKVRPLPISLRILSVLLIVPFFFVGLRGTYHGRPTQIDDASVTQDDFLNKAVINPYIALRYAYRDHIRLMAGNGLAAFVPDGNIAAAAGDVFSRSGSDMDSLMLKTARGPKGTPPKHIFLIVMESYDAWPLLPKYRSLGLTKELSALGEKGIHVLQFLPASTGTATSLSAIMTGLPDAGVETNYQERSRRPYPTAVAEIFRKLGYRTRFFYGGYLSWQNMDSLAKAQGFEELYGAAHIGSWASNNEWGVEDEHLFDFILKTVRKDQPSFNLIMTTSYHPPFKLDVRGKGFPLTEVPDDLKGVFGNTVDLNILGHLWYADRCIGEFVRKAEATLPLTLFAMTGDHYGRKFINDRPTFFEQSAVPLILYGPDTLRGISLPPGAAGSHIDIGPTLVELAAPKGFTYNSLGEDILGSRRRDIGIGVGKLVGNGFLADSAGHFYPLPDRKLPTRLPKAEEVKKLINEYHGIAWWRIKKGEQLPLKSAGS